jgi:arginine deiminase
MAKKTADTTLMVTSEIGTLRRLLVHSPDSGLGKVVPSKAQDWLFEDIVHLDTIRREEYDYYTKLLLYFLDPKKIKGKLNGIDDPAKRRNFYKPGHQQFYKSDKVIELQWLLEEILHHEQTKLELIASVSALEGVAYLEQQKLKQLKPDKLAKLFISGSYDDHLLLFAPIPNFIFTRDIGIVIKDHILLNKPAKQARTREALLAKYIFFHHPFFAKYQNNILELPEKHPHFLNPKEGGERKVTLEGGDVMVVSKDHLLIGISERTSWEAAHQAIRLLFEKKIMKKVTVVRIPKKRDYMHIDTIFTQVKKNVWVMLGSFSKKAMKKMDEDPIERALENNSKKEEKIAFIQFHHKKPDDPVYFDNLESLLDDISRNDLDCKEKTIFIYSGNNEFPFDAREQWTDSCNLLALKEGVVLGYDRNNKTTEAFQQAGFHVVHVADLLKDFESGKAIPAKMKDTLILMPSAELSRARGGFHCMSMPLLRDEVDE